MFVEKNAYIRLIVNNIIICNCLLPAFLETKPTVLIFQKPLYVTRKKKGIA